MGRARRHNGISFIILMKVKWNDSERNPPRSERCRRTMDRIYRNLIIWFDYLGGGGWKERGVAGHATLSSWHIWVKCIQLHSKLTALALIASQTMQFSKSRFEIAICRDVCRFSAWKGVSNQAYELTSMFLYFTFNVETAQFLIHEIQLIWTQTLFIFGPTYSSHASDFRSKSQ